MGGHEKGRFVVVLVCCLSAEAVQSASLTLESVDDVHSRHRLALGVLSVRHSVTDHILQEHFVNAASLLVDQTRDTLHTTSASQTTDRWFRDALDVVTKHLAMRLLRRPLPPLPRPDISSELKLRKTVEKVERMQMTGEAKWPSYFRSGQVNSGIQKAADVLLSRVLDASVSI